jgi:DNA-directed RNA polymerase specialized sigma subunit
MAETMGSIDKAQRRLRELDQRRRREQETIRELCMRCIELDDRERYVILKRYLYREKWQDIADWMDLTDRRIFQIHGEALDKLEAFLGP